MSVLEMVLIQLLLAFALARTCARQLCPHALAARASTCASALQIQLEYILGEGQRDPNGKQLAVLFLPSTISGFVDRHHGPLSCCPDACLADIDVDTKRHSLGGILSTSLVFCENTLNRTRSTSLSSFDPLEYSLQTEFVVTSISLGDIFGVEFQQ